LFNSRHQIAFLPPARNLIRTRFKGAKNALFLKDFVVKTSRSLRVRIENGRVSGGLRYG